MLHIYKLKNGVHWCYRQFIKMDPRHELIGLFTRGRQLTYAPGEIILRAWDVPSGVYYLESGNVTCYSLNAEGEECISMTYCPDQIFPIGWAISGMLRNIHYVSHNRTVLRRISREDFVRLLQADAKLSYLVLAEHVQQFFMLADHLGNLEYKSAYEKVAYRLLFLARRFGQPTDDSIVITLKLSHSHIARSINSTRETVSRELNRLERKGYIKKANGKIIIPDIQQLALQVDGVDLTSWGLP